MIIDKKKPIAPQILSIIETALMENGIEHSQSKRGRKETRFTIALESSDHCEVCTIVVASSRRKYDRD